MDKLQGTVTHYTPVKGFGFIKGNDGNSVFVHHSAILMEGFRKLRTGQAVTYEIGQDPQERACAVNVFVVD